MNISCNIWRWTGPGACRKTADRNSSAADGKRAIGNGACGLQQTDDAAGPGRRVSARTRNRAAAAAGLGTNDLISEKFRIPTRAVHNGLRDCTHTHTHPRTSVHTRTPAHTSTHLQYYIILHTCIIPLNKLADAINEQTICVRRSWFFRTTDIDGRRIYISCAPPIYLYFMCIICIITYLHAHTPFGPYITI